jgi:hypothetical protein
MQLLPTLRERGRLDSIHLPGDDDGAIVETISQSSMIDDVTIDVAIDRSVHR